MAYAEVTADNAESADADIVESILHQQSQHSRQLTSVAVSQPTNSKICYAQATCTQAMITFCSSVLYADICFSGNIIAGIQQISTDWMALM